MSRISDDQDFQAGIQLWQERHKEKPFKSWAEASQWWRENIAYDSLVATRYLANVYLRLDRKEVDAL